MKRVDNVLYDLIDSYTNEIATYTKVTNHVDGSVLNDSHVDGVIITKNGSEYFKRNIEKNINVLWFKGLVSNGYWHSALQKAVDVAIANRIKTVFIPEGNYSYSQPLMLYKWDGTNYQFFTIALEGVGGIMEVDQIGSNLTYTGTDGFGIGIQLGKGVEIKGIKLGGVYYPRSFPNQRAFYNSTYTEYMVGNTVRDSRYSPHAGIVIDPFRNNTSKPDDGGYPSMQEWYRGDGSKNNSGSTAIKISDIKIKNTVVCAITSPNGQTQNAEAIIIDKIQFENFKFAVSGCQDQERTNILRNFQAWGQGHTIYTNTQYGVSTSGHWNISNGNMAGANVQLFDITTGGRYAVNIDNVTAESFGKVGNISSGIGLTVSRCTFDFAPPDIAGYQETITASGVKFIDCNLRYYGVGIPLRLGGDSIYENCIFNAYPMTNIPAFNIRSTIVNCNNGTIGLQGTRQVNKTDTIGFSCYGNYKLRSVENTDVHVERFLIQEGYEDLYTSFRLQTTHVVVGLDGSMTCTCSDPVTDMKFLSVGRVVMCYGSVWGFITSIQDGVGFTCQFSNLWKFTMVILTIGILIYFIR